MKLDRIFRFVAVAALAAFAVTGVGLRVASEITLQSRAVIAPSALKTFNDNPSKAHDSILFVDAAASRSSAVQRVTSHLRHLGGDLYSGTITGAEVNLVSQISGISISLNSRTDTAPVSEKLSSYVGWDSAVSVSQTDPNLVSARASNHVDGTGVLVAVLDTGVDSKALGLGNSKVVYRQDFTTPPVDGSCSDGNNLDPFGHGTHVASIIAGAPDARDPDIVGVAPGASIVDLRVLNCAGSGDMSQVAQALQWILDNQATYPIKVVNLSLGANDEQKDGRDPVSILVNRLVAHGVFVAIAAGNNGTAAGALTAPGTAEFATTVAAATVNKYGKYLAPFSSIGPTSDGRVGIDLTAPGGGIRAALTTAKTNGGYEQTMSGTSMATPYVAGTAALLIQQHPDALPSGTTCELSVSCPSGVVANTMTNSIQALMKTADWFTPGADVESGMGLLSTSASLNGTDVAAASYLSQTIDDQSDNVVTIPAHANPTCVTLMFGHSYLNNMFDTVSRMHIMLMDNNYRVLDPMLPLTLLSSNSGLFGEMTFFPRSYTYYLAPSDTPVTIVVKTNVANSVVVNVDSLGGEMTYHQGISVSNIDVSSGSGTITVKRTMDSATDDTFTVTHTGTLNVQDTATLPAGPAGTQITVSVSLASPSTYAKEQVVFKSPDGNMVASSVLTRLDGDGGLIYPNTDKVDDSNGMPQPVLLASDGTILSGSRTAGVANSSGYDNPYVVSANSRTVVPLPFGQSTPTEIDTISLSDDGTTGIFREYPAGVGVVPGDESLNYNYFVRKISGGQAYEVGPDWTLWNPWYNAPLPAMTINEDGSSVMWATVLPSGDNPVVVVKQSGATFADKETWDAFPTNSNIWLYGYMHGRLLMRIQNTTSGLDEVRIYTAAHTYTVLPGNDFNAWNVTFSADGQAVGYENPNNETMKCYVNGQVTTFPAPTQFGSSNISQIRVANDCSWFIAGWDKSPSWPRAENGVQLLKLMSDGRIFRLDQTDGKLHNVYWLMNLAATKFLRVASSGLEPGDHLGLGGIYRGLGMSTPTQIFLRSAAVVRWTMDTSPMTPGAQRTLSATTTSATPVTYKVLAGNCHIAGDKLIADSGTGFCTVEADSAESDTFLKGSTSFMFSLMKGNLTTNSYSITFPTNLSVGDDKDLAFNDNSLGGFNLVGLGACRVTSGHLLAQSTGSCTVTVTRVEDANYLPFSYIKTIAVSKGAWSSSDLSLADPGPQLAGDSFQLGMTNATALPASITASGACTIAGTTVTTKAVSGSCVITATVSESQNHLAKTVSITVPVTLLVVVQPQVSDLDWKPLNALPKGSTLTFNAHATLVSGPCIVDGTALTANAETGSCLVTVGGYRTNFFSFTAQTFTIYLGPAAQSWAVALPTFATKKVTAAKFTFITTGIPKTSLGISGAFTVTAGAKVTISGKTVTVDMGKLKSCVVTLKAPPGFRVPGITRSWTFTR